MIKVNTLVYNRTSLLSNVKCDFLDGGVDRPSPARGEDRGREVYLKSRYGVRLQSLFDRINDGRLDSFDGVGTPPLLSLLLLLSRRARIPLGVGPCGLLAGGPKRFGKVTVYVDRKTQIYRVKPEYASRKTDNIIWGRTEEDYLVQWKKVLDKARHYNRVGT